jgi:hypothetical protein
LLICKVTAAATHGAIGALLYPDPYYYSREGQSDEDTYPNTVWSSRDAIYEKPLRYMFGDPLTPDLPSIPGMYRRPLNETGLPSIPSQPISYKDAMFLLSKMNGNYIQGIIKRSARKSMSHSMYCDINTLGVGSQVFDFSSALCTECLYHSKHTQAFLHLIVNKVIEFFF